MVSFHLYDSKSRQVREFIPLVEGKVSIYHCGLTVQAPPHLGHIRKEVVFDVLRRWLTHLGYQVSIVANVTDIDDKILTKSAQQSMEWFELGYSVELELHRAYQALGCLPPTYEPRATGHIPEMIQLTQKLIDAGHAYPAEDGSGDVYFDVQSWPDYGSLSGQRIEEMEADTDADPRGKRDPRDFALWKGHKPSEPETASWPSPWGPGRPGWHLECSAMSAKYLGESFDIHGGGIDLRFPHHENEMAQSQAAGLGFARYWMHNAWVTMAGEKMSKSLGNTALVTEVTKRFNPRAVRLYLVGPHYRSKIEYSEEHLANAEAQIERIDSFMTKAESKLAVTGFDESRLADYLPADFCKAMNDDLATPQAMAALFNTVRAGNQALTGPDVDLASVGDYYRSVKAMLTIFGLDPSSPEWANSTSGGNENLMNVIDRLVTGLLDERQQARAEKNWARADQIRDLLSDAGLKIEDTPDGARWSVE